jgi:hypothetical protein
MQLRPERIAHLTWTRDATRDDLVAGEDKVDPRSARNRENIVAAHGGNRDVRWIQHDSCCAHSLTDVSLFARRPDVHSV